jgi:hypothetical protein
MPGMLQWPQGKYALGLLIGILQDYWQVSSQTT